MAALSRRDIEMIFRADTDKATRPIGELGKAVKAARSQLEDLVSAATTSESSLDKLGSTTRDLKKAQDELGSARSLLTSLNSQIGALEKAEAKVEETGAKYRELKAQVEGAEAPTKRLTNSMLAAERAFNAAQERLGRVSAEAQETREQIEGIIGPVHSVDASFREIANTSKDIARGLAVAGEAADSFKAKLAAAAAASAGVDSKLNADVAFEQQGRSAGLLQAQIDYISQFENRVELLAQAKRELASQNATFDQALTAQEAKVGAANVAELRREITDTFAAAQRAEQITAFRQLATDANASVNDVSRFAVAEDEATASTRRLADALGDILNPGRAAKASIDGIESAVAQAAGALEGKGRRSLQEYNEALNELSASGASIGKIAQQIDAFKDQQAAVDRAAAAMRQAQGDVRVLAADLRLAEEPTDAMAAALKRAEANVETAGNAMRDEGLKAQAMATALKRAGVDVNNLTEAEQRLALAAQNAAEAQEDIRKKSGGQAGGGLLGLSVQDATNLSYQLNDIFTQLASGQSIFITLAQQGPQIWQIQGIKNYAAGLGELLPLLLGVAAGLGVVAGGVALVYAATGDSKELTAAKAYIASLGEAGTLTAQQLATATDKLDDLGVKAAEANTILRAFNEGGFNASYLDAYIESAKNAAQVTGEDIPTAAAALTDAMSGGYDAVVKLNEQFPVLTDAELTQIQAMYDSGRADEARQLIFDRFTQKYADAAALMNGPWSNAWDNLKHAAERFGYYVGVGLDTILSGLRTRLDEAAIGVNYLLLRMRGLSHEQAGIAAVQNQGKAPTTAPKGGVGGTRTNAAGQAAIRDAEREIDVRKRLTAAQRQENAAIEARRKALASGYGTADAERLAQLASAKEGRAIADEQAKAGARRQKKADSDRKRAQREAETLANKIEGQAEQLQSALDAMGAKVSKVAAGTLQQQLQAAADAVEQQYAKTLRKVQEFSKLTAGKGRIGKLSIPEYTAQIEANKTILANQAQLKVYEDNINDVLQQRKTLLADIEDRAQRGDITSADAIRQTAEVTSRFEPIISDLTNAAVTFAESIGGATPSAELQAFITKMQSIGTQNAFGDQSANRKEATARLGAEESKLNTIISQRNALVESYNTLQELGLITAAEARKRSADAYNAARAQIVEQSNAVRATLEAGKASFDPLVYDAMIAKLQAIGAQADYLDPRFAQLKQGIDSIITQNAVDGILSIVQGFAEAAAGTQSWGDALRNAGLAVVNFIGQTLLMIGKLILQMLVLAAVQAATGIPVAALLGAMNGGGGGGAGGGGGGFKLFGLKLFHGGGEVGNSLTGQQRTTRGISVSPATLAAAPRYHDGTPSVGLKPQEQLAVLEKGERVLTEEQQRREAASKGSSGGSRGLRQVLAFGDDQVAAAMQGPAGEDVTLTHIRRNVPLLKQMIQE